MAARGRRFAIAAAAAGIATMVAAGFALRGAAVEQWRLWKLESNGLP